MMTGGRTPVPIKDSRTSGSDVDVGISKVVLVVTIVLTSSVELGPTISPMRSVNPRLVDVDVVELSIVC